MGASHNSSLLDKRPLPRGKGPALQAFTMLELMKRNVSSILKLLNEPWHEHIQFIFALHPSSNCELWCTNQSTLCVFDILSFIQMPRERGKPRRGSAWYTHVAQQQKRQQMEQALSLARTILRQRAKKDGLPPMACVEETSQKESVQTLPNHLLLTELENWQPARHFQEENISTAPENQTRRSIAAEYCDDFPTCYIEEEIYEEMVSLEVTTKAKQLVDTRGEDEGAGDEEPEDAAPSAAVENGLEVTSGEGGEIPVPPPMHGQGRAPPPFLHPEHLDIMFDLRGHMADHVHRVLLMS